MHVMDATPAPSFPIKHPHAPPLRPQAPEDRAREEHLEALDEDSIACAKSLIDAKEYTRAVHWLRECKSSKAMFMNLYSQYMVSSCTAPTPQTFDDRQIQGQREAGNA